MTITRADAEDALIEYGMIAADRDRIVLAALAAGVSKRRAAALSGLARMTVDKIERTGRDGAASAS